VRAEVAVRVRMAAGDQLIGVSHPRSLLSQSCGPSSPKFGRESMPVAVT
jgi:hypothetical protein